MTTTTPPAQDGERERLNRNRPSRNPGGMECFICGSIFIGDESHEFCAVCAAAPTVPNIAGLQEHVATQSAELAALRAQVEGLKEKYQTAIGHLQHARACQVCADGDWSDCEHGAEANEIIEQFIDAALARRSRLQRRRSRDAD